MCLTVPIIHLTIFPHGEVSMSWLSPATPFHPIISELAMPWEEERCGREKSIPVLLLVTSGGLRVYNSAFAFLRFACPRAKEAMFNVSLDSLLSFAAPVCLCRRRPYLSEHTGSLSTSEVKRRRDWPRGLAGKRVGRCRLFVQSDCKLLLRVWGNLGVTQAHP